MLTLLWGSTDDPPLAAVAAALVRAGAAFVRVGADTSDAALDWRCDGGISGALTVGGRRIDLGEVRSMYLRPAPAIAGAPDALDRALYTFAEVADARVLSRPSAMAANHAKPYQLAQLEALGFAVPETLVTTDAEAARAFVARHREVIYKSVSGVRSRVARVGEAQIARLDDLRWCPTQLQRRVAGRDVRVHVVGEAVFACEVLSCADDYRYPGAGDAPTRLRSVKLPAEVAGRCRAASRALGLPLAGVDLRRGDDGRWYAFEVNPSPAFTCFEVDDARPIAAAVARWLAAP